MSLPLRRLRGFTLIELMVTIVVMLVLALVAMPSFQAQRQRAALRGAGEQLTSFWNQARLEAAKRNQLVKVGVVASSGAFCLGANSTTISDAAINTTCDCTTAGSCNIASYPADQSAWNGVTLSGVTLGGATWPGATMTTAVIESKRTALLDGAKAGRIVLQGPPGPKSYSLQFNVDQFGRAVLCEPAAAVDKLSDYGNQRCSL